MVTLTHFSLLILVYMVLPFVSTFSYVLYKHFCDNSGSTVSLDRNFNLLLEGACLNILHMLLP